MLKTLSFVANAFSKREHAHCHSLWLSVSVSVFAVRRTQPNLNICCSTRLPYSNKFGATYLKMEGEPKEDMEKGEVSDEIDRPEKSNPRAIGELISRRLESEITIEATVDTGFEFMAIEECKAKFGKEIDVIKERGRIMFNIDKSKYSEVLLMRSVDNLYLVLSYDSSVGFQGSNTAEDIAIAAKQAHTPEWDRWLNVWKDLVEFKGILRPSTEEYAAANERATKDKEEEKIRQAERQKKYKERQQRNAEKQAKRKAKADLIRAQYNARRAAADNDQKEPESSKGDSDEASSGMKCELEKTDGKIEETSPKEDVLESVSGIEETVQDLQIQSENVKLDKIGVENVELDHSQDVAAPNPCPEEAEVNVDSDDEIQSLPDYDREVEREIDQTVPPEKRVLRFRATCFRVGKHTFGSMEAAREFGGALQDKFNWVVDLVNFNAEVILFVVKDTAQVSIALTKKSLHRRNISFFGPTTLRSTVCHNLLRLADVKQGDIVLDPLAGGGSVPIEGAMSFPGTFHIGGDNHSKAMSRLYSNLRVLHEEIGKELPLGAVRWDARRLPLNEASVDVIVSDLPFGVRLGSKSGNRNLYRRVLLEMARVTRPGTGRAILLTQDRRSFALALVGTMGLWWQSKVMSANIGGLDAAVFTLRRTAKVRPDEADLAAAAELAKDQDKWREGGYSRGGYGRGQSHGHQGRGGRGQGQGRGRGWGGRGRGYPRGGNKQSGSGGNWRDHGSKGSPKPEAN
ncbi:tRNA (guanine(6)-N2)-methyltransferase THUMP3 [Frankliniella occidentalis]|uniref:tRNA (Guanine(6)-N2)-methyltransferase THUMP3 n=1 Tax=Frankliniella occidentalis TaxID=133901 RepID=A0A6J1SHE3_FRAOC|nr:tRNA (guanine(6)-N2)-methyltransferase THUMP3 [Frankliniella occidentalis]